MSSLDIGDVFVLLTTHFDFPRSGCHMGGAKFLWKERMEFKLHLDKIVEALTDFK